MMRKTVDIPLRLPRNYLPESLPLQPIDKDLRVGVVLPQHVRLLSARWTTPVKWARAPRKALLKPFPKGNVTEVDLLVIDTAEPVAGALPKIFRRLFPRAKVLTTPDCAACDVIFTVTAVSETIADSQNNLVGITVRVSVDATDRNGNTAGPIVGVGSSGSTRKMHWTSHSHARAIGTPALKAALESVFFKMAENGSPMRAFLGDRAIELERPADLETTVTFDDAASLFPNDRLDAGEIARLRFRIHNRGAGQAFAVRLRLAAAPDAVTLPPEVVVGDIAARGSKEINVPLAAGIDVRTAQQQLRVETLEKRGYGGRAVVAQLATQQLQKPALEIADIRVEDRGEHTNGDGDGRASNGETVAAVILVSNKGSGDAAGAMLTISSTPGVEVVEPSINVGALPVNGVKEVRTLLRIPITFHASDFGLTVRAIETRGAAVSSADAQRRWVLQLKRPQVEVGFRLLDGNSPKSQGNRDGIANNGETIELTVVPSNRGTLAARGLRLAFATPLPGIEIKPATVEVGELPPHAEGVEYRVQILVPRAITEDALQRLPVDVTIRQADFPDGRQVLGLPFSAQRPALLATVAAQSPVVEGKPALFAVDVANDGHLAAEDVKVEVTSDNPAVELLDAVGRPVRTLRLDVGSIAARTAAQRLQLRAHIRRNIPGIAALLKVLVTQRDFSGTGAQAALTIVKEEADVIDAGPPVLPATVVPRVAGVPATISFQRYADGASVADSTIRLSFEVQSHTMVEMVRLEQNHRTIELPESLPIRSGRTLLWQYGPQVQLDYGPNDFEVVVITSEGLRNSRSMTLHREKPLGKIWLAVVGISQYRDASLGDLSFARDDALAVHAYYRDRGVPQEQVIELLDENATLANIKRRLGTDLVKAAANPDDTVLIYFAGHGLMEADRSSADSDGYSKYLLPHDANPSDLFGSALSMEELSRILQRLRPERVVLIIDSCFSGAAGGRTPYETNDAWRGVITEEFLVRIASVGKGRVILTASSSREVAQESNSMRHGIFTYFLLEGLRGFADTDADGRIDVDEIYKYVSQKVSAATRGRQNPMRKAPNLTGTLVLGGRLH